MHADNYENIMSGFVRETHGDDGPQEGGASPVVVNCANNHGIDYGRRALDEETLPLFERLNNDAFQTIGLGKNLRDASKPATITCVGANVQVFAFSSGCSGTPTDWWATDSRSGLLGLPGLYTKGDVDSAMAIASEAFEKAQGVKEPTLRIVSVHWGPNWAMKGESGEQLAARRHFAHRMIDECGVDVIYGHSSHHARGIEVYNGKLILYGAGDIINDYEGFENPGEERYNRLGGIYLVDLDPSSGTFRQLRIVPMFMDRLRLRRALPSSAMWRPQQRRLERDPSKIKDFCRFLNDMSRMDAGGKEGALELQYIEADEQLPGGPILRSKRC